METNLQSISEKEVSTIDIKNLKKKILELDPSFDIGHVVINLSAITIKDGPLCTKFIFDSIERLDKWNIQDYLALLDEVRTMANGKSEYKYEELINMYFLDD